ncbi:MAG: hypothetical protein DWC06_00480 [Candidatus Poseidoniales archaeon]|nr:MAG: hypothetical protein DWC06_00480 [Candidatus Poseidoniales archaeon]
MSEYSDKGPLAARLWLTGLVFCQIFLTPMAAFSITYLVEFNRVSENFTISFQTEMIPWILAASLAYGMLALILALMFGGFTPISVVEKGGWRSALGLTRSKRDAATLRNSRRNHANSPHARLTVMVSDRIVKKHSLLSTHGGLVLLAIPFQLMLVVIPLGFVIFIPDEWIRTDRRLEVAMACYLIVLIMVMRLFPKFARKHITTAAFTRRWLVSMTKLSFLAPVLVLWLMGRIASVIVLSWIGADVSSNLQLEQSFMEDFLNIGSVPETSFLDLLTALAVMPLAAFTTLACLGGGSGSPPAWMRIGNEIEIKTPEQEGDGGALVSIGRTVGTVTGAAVGIGIGVAATAASGIAAKAQSAGSSAVAAANATPQAMSSGIDVVNATDEAFSFVDESQTYSEVASNIEVEPEEETTSEFEGLGSMFD